MSALIAMSTSGFIASLCIALLVLCALIAVVGTRFVRAEQRRQVRYWRLARKPVPKDDED
ncbi:MAG TPA: hypothetical protein PKZ32_00750 [Candidatus Melainabacteria bacterium]|nr:hypothetical protein [Candidatus Melainabacteria bacterium]